ncbi:DUF4249 family protein [Aureibacter tunicatorum]|uniref:DUF4249 domain-containing protein n=1 Tax=Aureibacter tunicatorum TaxID=866807 RepID=A0AAE4BRC9_9BACT|nr:DUF4249 family protein [Aureibacter tunicatorum]MDR6237117.1 hypothetical protein [Aureibacter tunicatorum]
MNIRNLYICFLFAIFTFSCEERINTEVDNTEYIIVDALLIDSLSYQKIEITKSNNINEGFVMKGVENALVTVNDSKGNVYHFKESSNDYYKDNYSLASNKTKGVYIGLMAIEPNTYYTLDIELASGEKIYSDEIILEEKATVTNQEFELFNFQRKTAYINDAEVIKNFFSIRQKKEINNHKDVYFVNKYSSVYEYNLLNYDCNILLRDTQNDFESKLSLLNINSSNSGESFTILENLEANEKHIYNYLFKVQQIQINKEYYDFLQKIKILKENNGGLFDKIPGRIEPNVYSNKNINIQGFFSLGYSNIYIPKKAINQLDFPFKFQLPCPPSVYNNPRSGPPNACICIHPEEELFSPYFHKYWYLDDNYRSKI